MWLTSSGDAGRWGSSGSLRAGSQGLARSDTKRGLRACAREHEQWAGASPGLVCPLALQNIGPCGFKCFNISSELMTQTLPTSPSPAAPQASVCLFLVKVNKFGICLKKSVPTPPCFPGGYPKSFQNESWELLLAETAGDIPAGEEEKTLGLEGTDLNSDPSFATYWLCDLGHSNQPPNASVSTSVERGSSWQGFSV